MPIIRLENLLNSAAGSDLGKLVQNAQFMQNLTLALRRGLDGELADNLLGANVRDSGELVVSATTPAWAAKLRFESERLLGAARDHGIEVQRCKVTVSRQ
jgi:hypothetical protein